MNEGVAIIRSGYYMERKELENVSDFTLGEENVAFAPYFIERVT